MQQDSLESCLTYNSHLKHTLLKKTAEIWPVLPSLLIFVDLFSESQTNLRSKYTLRTRHTPLLSVTTDITTSYYSSIAWATNKSKVKHYAQNDKLSGPFSVQRKPYLRRLVRSYYSGCTVRGVPPQHKPFLTEKAGSILNRLHTLRL